MAAIEQAFSETQPDNLFEMDFQATPPMVLPSSLQIEALLRGSRTIAVVGLSPKPERDSYEVAEYMQSKGYRILPVNPVVAASATPTILGERCYASLTDAAFSLGENSHIDIVNVFRRSDQVPGIVEEALMVAAQAIWLQLGVINDTAAKLAQDMGLVVVQDRCLKIEHGRALG